MPRPLTVKIVENAKPNPKKRSEIPDGAVSGLRLIVQPTGAKSWAVRYRIDGRAAKFTLGPFPRLGLGDAREAARETLRLVSEGKDPNADRVTVAGLKRLPVVNIDRRFETVLERFLASQRVKGRRTVDEVGRQMNKDATPYWRGRSVDKISPADVVERIEAIAVGRGSPVAAAQFRAALGKLFSFAVKAQLRADNPVRATESP